MKSKIIVSFALIMLLLTYCKKPADPIKKVTSITELSSVNVKYGNILTILGKNFNTMAGINKVLITDSTKSYILTPLSVSTDQIKVEIYNHEDPASLLQLQKFYVGIKTTDSVIMSKQQVTLNNSWSRVADFAGPARYKSSIFTMDGNYYVCGGAAGFVYKDLWKYSPANDSWVRKADLPGVERCYPRAFSNSAYGYVGAGFTTDNSPKTQLYDFYKYSPVSDSWTAIPNYPDNILNYYVGYTVTVNGRPFISLSNQVLTMRELANDTWNSTPTVQDMIDCPASGVFAIGKKFYVVVGNRINNAFSNAVWEYNTENTTWTKKSNFPGAARYAPAFFSIGNYGYYGCGMSTDQTQYNDFWRYDPAQDLWIRIDNFAGGDRSHLVSASDGEVGFAGLGIDWAFLNYKSDFYKFDPR